MIREVIMRKKSDSNNSLIDIFGEVGIISLILLIFLCTIFAFFPEKSKIILEKLRFFLADNYGLYYAALGLGIFLCTIFIAFSKYGKIKLGKESDEKEYPSFIWGTMIFTSTMAADILFFSLCEWSLYYNEPYIQNLGSLQLWASTYPLFHWGPTVWGFYVILSVSFGFMVHVRNRKCQKFSEACRPIFKEKIDGICGRIIDLIAIFSLIAGTSTTFSLATPLLSKVISKFFYIQNTTIFTILILIIIAVIYTIAVLSGMKTISNLAKYSSYIFFLLIAYFLFAGGETVYILETGFSAIGNLAQNFILMSTWLDPLRETYFPQKWTIYYWSYWMVWCVATPFFIGKISKGRTIKDTILGIYMYGISGTFMSFIVMGNYGLSLQLNNKLDIVGIIAKTSDYSEAIIKIFDTLPFPNIALIILVLTMIMLYVTTFDALVMVASVYSYNMSDMEMEADKKNKIFWSIIFILFPIVLIFFKNSMYNLQSISIIAAFPIGIIIIFIIISFFKDANKYLTEYDK